jgi:hypothetical protein
VRHCLTAASKATIQGRPILGAKWQHTAHPRSRYTMPQQHAAAVAADIAAAATAACYCGGCMHCSACVHCMLLRWLPTLLPLGSCIGRAPASTTHGSQCPCSSHMIRIPAAEQKNSRILVSMQHLDCTSVGARLSRGSMLPTVVHNDTAACCIRYGTATGCCFCPCAGLLLPSCYFWLIPHNASTSAFYTGATSHILHSMTFYC